MQKACFAHSKRNEMIKPARIIRRFRCIRPTDPDQARFERLGKLLQSPIERLFWEHGYNRLSKLGRFTPQVEIGRYRADFTLDRIPGVSLLKVVIEVDGYDHHSTPSQRNYDTARDRDLEKAGWRVIHFTGSHIYLDCAGRVRETEELVKAYSKWLRC